MTPGIHGPNPWLASVAEVVGHRLPWQVPTVTVGEQEVRMSTLVTEVLRILDELHLLYGGDEVPTPSAVDVDRAAQLLATGSPRYGVDGYGWRAVLASPENLTHAYRASVAAAPDQRTRDDLSTAYALLQRHLAAAARRAAPRDDPESTTVESAP